MRAQAAVPVLVTILCSCQRRVRVPVKAFGRPRNCPTCGRTFKVEGAAGKNARLVFLKTLPRAKPTGPRCPCGAPLHVNAGNRGKNVTCPSCRKALRFEESRDPQTLLTTVYSVDPNVPRKKAKLYFPPHRILCACGTKLLVDPKQWGKRGRCAKCGSSINLDKAQDPQTLRTALLPRVGKGAPTLRVESWSLDDFN